MSSLHLAAVWRLKLDTTAKLLLAYLADCVDHTGTTGPIATHALAEQVGRNNKTTNKALRTLEDAALLERSIGSWHLTLDTDMAVDEYIKPFPKPATIIPENIPKPKPARLAGDRLVKTEPPPESHEPSPIEKRMLDFADTWGLTSPSIALSAAWLALEAAEAKYNRTEKHSDGDKSWVKPIESMDELMPQILQAVAVFQKRAEDGVTNHADGAAEFVEKTLWLAPDYQVSLDAEPPPPPKTEAELDEFVMKMNRKGGPFSTHLRVSSLNKHTGEVETETLAIYEKRVMAKWGQYLAAADAFTE